MKILLIISLFQPEPNHLKGLAYARQVAHQGHSVQVLTGFPNYPDGKVYKGYKVKWRMRELMDGIEVIRVAHYPSHDRSGMRRFINYFSFALAASSIGLFSVRRPDVIHVSQGVPTIMLPAILLKILYRVPIVLDIQDLWPESVISSGMFHVPGGLWMLYLWCRFTYAVSKKIIVLSSGYKALLEKRGVHRDKIEVVYNWCDESSIENLPRNENVGVKFGLQDKFNVVFTGTMGMVQALDAVLDAADIIKTELPGVQLVFVGGGVDLPKLMDSASSRNLTNVVFIPRQPASEISKILAFADVLLIHLRGDLLGRIGIPQKTQAYLASGKPIIAAVDGEAAEIVKAAHAGIACMPENSVAIASAIRQLFSMPVTERETMGKNGQRYYHENFSFKKGVTEMINIYQKSL